MYSKTKRGQVVYSVYLARDRQPKTGTSGHPMICDIGYDRVRVRVYIGAINKIEKQKQGK